MAHKSLPLSVQREVLIEAGYRCAVPTCRNILALDLHHIIEVREGGPSEPWNLIALCANCHALYTRGHITREGVNSWKTMLVALNHAFDQVSISNLLFLKVIEDRTLEVSGDGVLKFSHLIGSGLATFGASTRHGLLVLYRVSLTDRGRRILEAWFSGDRRQVEAAIRDLNDERSASH
jgi:hypothetical protein